MRSTKASAAVARLNVRDTKYRYSMGITGSELFYLLRTSPGAGAEKVSDDMDLDTFVTFVNKTGPQKAARVSKYDTAFEKQLTGKNRAE